MRATEYRTEPASGFTLDQATGVATPTDGLVIRWRFVGDRRWRKRTILPDAELGQTVESLAGDAAVIVAALARQELAGVES